jgi:hypothetical protein
VLAAAVEKRQDLTADALGHLAALELACPWRMPFDVRAFVRRRLDAREAGIVRAAAAATLRMHDAGAIPELIDLLGDPREGSEATARWTLRVLAGHDPATPAEWTAWFETQLASWERLREEARRKLERGDAGAARDALKDLALVALWKHEAAELVTIALQRPEPDVRVLACTALRLLGSRQPVPALTAALESPAPEVREAAWNALRGLTGVDLGSEPGPWRDWVAGR